MIEKVNKLKNELRNVDKTMKSLKDKEITLAIDSIQKSNEFLNQKDALQACESILLGGLHLANLEKIESYIMPKDSSLSKVSQSGEGSIEIKMAKANEKIWISGVNTSFSVFIDNKLDIPQQVTVAARPRHPYWVLDGFFGFIFGVTEYFEPWNKQS